MKGDYRKEIPLEMKGDYRNEIPLEMKGDYRKEIPYLLRSGDERNNERGSEVDVINEYNYLYLSYFDPHLYVHIKLNIYLYIF